MIHDTSHTGVGGGVRQLGWAALGLLRFRHSCKQKTTLVGHSVAQSGTGTQSGHFRYMRNLYNLEHVEECNRSEIFRGLSTIPCMH